MKKNKNLRIAFWLRILLLLCGLLANAVVLNNYRKVGSDFVQDYISANSLLRGGSAYGEDYKKLANEILEFREMPNFHPPFNALLFLPLAFLSYETAYIFLGIFSIILLLIINHFTVKGLELNSNWFLNLTCFTLCWYPVVSCLGTGQSSIIIAACLIVGWFCLRSEKAYVAGFFFAIATLIKLFPGLVLLYLFIRKDRRTFFATVFFIILGLSVTTLVVGLDDMWTYSIIIIARDVNEYSGYVLNHSVTGIVARIFGNPVGWTEPLVQLPYLSFLLAVLLKLSILICTVLKIRKMTDRGKLDSYAFCLTLVTMLLLSPLTWGHIFPVLILPICLLLREYIDEPSLRKFCLLLIILFCVSLPDVLIARKLMEIHHPFRMPWYSMLLTLGPGAGLILLWIVLSRRDINRPA